jgi:hypothetical protein
MKDFRDRMETTRNNKNKTNKKQKNRKNISGETLIGVVFS